MVSVVVIIILKVARVFLGKETKVNSTFNYIQFKHQLGINIMYRVIKVVKEACHDTILVGF